MDQQYYNNQVKSQSALVQQQRGSKCVVLLYLLGVGIWE
jgi:hypothetical protein